MGMYAKLFTSIYQGTLRGNSRGLLVFTNLLAHADQNGIVDIHPRAIADEVGLSHEQVCEALLELEAPDPESRSPDEEGRRIVRLDEHRAWGWQVVNYLKYRAIRSEDDRREQNRLAQQRWRERNKSKPASAEGETDKPIQKQKEKQKKDPPTPRKWEGEPVGFDRFWQAYPRKVNKPGAVKAFARLRADDAMIDAIVTAVQKQAASQDWRKDEGRFVPHPATWLNGRRWEDMTTPEDDDPYELRRAL